MTAIATGALIDLIAAELRPHVAGEDAADAIATSIVGELQSKFLLIGRPSEGAAKERS